MAGKIRKERESARRLERMLKRQKDAVCKVHGIGLKVGSSKGAGKSKAEQMND